MIEKSHERMPWCSNEGMIYLPSGAWAVKLLVRWDEQIETVTGPDGERIEYSYTSHRIIHELPDVAPHDNDELPYYIEQFKDTIVANAQNNLIQDDGFHDI